MTALIQGQDIGADHRGSGQLMEPLFWESRKRRIEELDPERKKA